MLLVAAGKNNINLEVVKCYRKELHPAVTFDALHYNNIIVILRKWS